MINKIRNWWNDTTTYDMPKKHTGWIVDNLMKAESGNHSKHVKAVIFTNESAARAYRRTQIEKGLEPDYPRKYYGSM